MTLSESREIGRVLCTNGGNARFSCLQVLVDLYAAVGDKKSLPEHIGMAMQGNASSGASLTHDRHRLIHAIGNNCVGRRLYSS
jgi:hypothetical protein